jgi:hypothetical protein
MNQVTYANCVIHDCKGMTIHEFTEKYQQNPLQGSQQWIVSIGNPHKEIHVSNIISLVLTHCICGT